MKQKCRVTSHDVIIIHWMLDVPGSLHFPLSHAISTLNLVPILKVYDPLNQTINIYIYIYCGPRIDFLTLPFHPPLFFIWVFFAGVEGGSASANGLSSRGKFAEVSLSGMEPKNTPTVMEILGFVMIFPD